MLIEIWGGEKKSLIWIRTLMGRLGPWSISLLSKSLGCRLRIVVLAINFEPKLVLLASFNTKLRTINRILYCHKIFMNSPSCVDSVSEKGLWLWAQWKVLEAPTLLVVATACQRPQVCNADTDASGTMNVKFRLLAQLEDNISCFDPVS